MSENSNNQESEKIEYTSRLYNCPKCRIIHTVELPKNITRNQPTFPVPFVFLHSSESEENLEDLLTILYIDVQLHIRAVEVIEVENSNIFSEELTKQITEKLMEKILSLEQENLQLKDLLNNLEIDKFSEIENENPKVLSIPNLDIKAQPISLEPQLDNIKEIESKPYLDLELTKIPDLVSKTPVEESIQSGESIIVFIISTIGPGEKKQDLTINLDNKINALKETIGNIYGLDPGNFHLSSGGITFDENLILSDYNLEEGDEILIIPSSTAGFI